MKWSSEDSRFIIGHEHAEGVGGERIEVDIVIISAGVRPNTELARQMVDEAGNTRGIRVNHSMTMTTIPGIQANF